MSSGADDLDRFPNMSVDVDARKLESSENSRELLGICFEKYQGRIVFGADATPHGREYPQPILNDKVYEIYYRFLETDDEYFGDASAKVLLKGGGVSSA
jgi:hypothetical protein